MLAREVVAGAVVVVAILKFSPSHVIPYGHDAHSSSPETPIKIKFALLGKYHFGPVCSSPLSRSTSGVTHVQEANV